MSGELGALDNRERAAAGIDCCSLASIVAWSARIEEYVKLAQFLTCTAFRDLRAAYWGRLALRDS